MLIHVRRIVVLLVAAAIVLPLAAAPIGHDFRSRADSSIIVRIDSRDGSFRVLAALPPFPEAIEARHRLSTTRAEYVDDQGRRFARAVGVSVDPSSMLSTDSNGYVTIALPYAEAWNVHEISILNGSSWTISGENLRNQIADLLSQPGSERAGGRVIRPELAADWTLTCYRLGSGAANDCNQAVMCFNCANIGSFEICQDPWVARSCGL